MAELRDTLNLFARRFVLALQNSTRVRAGGGFAEPAADLEEASTAHVPGVGALIGIAACLAFAVVSLSVGESPWAPLVAAVACTMVTAALTGAIHEGALFRVADGAGADAHRPGQGTLALVLLLAAKFALLAALADASEPAVITALLAAHVVSRFMLVVAHWAASADTDTRSLRVGALWCVVPLLLLVPAGGLVFLLVPLVFSGLACFAFLRWCRLRSDVPTADRPGAVQQVSELAFYFGAAIAA